MLRITDINYMAPRYRPGRTIVPATKDRFINNLPDLSQLLCNKRINLAASINKLQIVQNAAARVLTRSRKYDHITPNFRVSALATY